MTLEIYIPRTAPILPVPDNDEAGRHYLWALDTGCPFSFCRDRSIIHRQTTRLVPHPDGDGAWSEAKVPKGERKLTDALDRLEPTLGVCLEGLLGWDFLKGFGCFTLSTARRTLEPGGPGEFDVEMVLEDEPRVPLTRVRVEGKQRSCLVDTLSIQSLSPGRLAGNYPVSRGGRVPSFGGMVTVDYFAGVPLDLGGPNGSMCCTVAVPCGSMDVPAEFVLGQGVLSRYAVTFDLGRGRIGLSTLRGRSRGSR